MYDKAANVIEKARLRRPTALPAVAIDAASGWITPGGHRRDTEEERALIPPDGETGVHAITDLDVTLAGGGEMGARMRAMNWEDTPLGPVARWPQALKTCVRIMLTSRQPMWLGWGDELTYLYNDAYRSIAGGKHPAALGQPTSVVWREIWDDIGPRIASTMVGDEGTYDEALLLLMERHGYTEETYYTFSYSPIPDDDGQVRGLFCANTDDTRRIVNERQIGLLRELAAGTTEARSIEDACRLSARSLEANTRDLPFALIYLLDPDRGRLVLAGRSNIDAGHPAALGERAIDDGPWPLGDVVSGNTSCLFDDIDTMFEALPSGAWDRPPRQAVALPIAASGQTGQSGVLIAGLNPYRLFDDDYQGFLALVAGQIAAAIADAQAYEEERRRAEALAELDRAKTTFFSNISHELRTPLTLMLGPLEDMLRGDRDGLNPSQRTELDLVHRNGLRLLRMVNALLDFSRIEAGRADAAYRPTDLPGLIANLSSAFRSTIERAGLRLVVDCPPLPDGVTAVVDRQMWEKIVMNLLANAFKFTFEGEITISVRPDPDGTSLTLTVRDTGVGIPPAELPKLFDRFHRVQGTEARTHEGAGIGLALVHELVRLHGGTIDVESAQGEGTTFTITIPSGSSHLPEDRIVKEGSTTVVPSGDTSYVEEARRWLPDLEDLVGDVDDRNTALLLEVSDDPDHTSATGIDPGGTSHARILIADDNADMRDYVRRLLRDRYTVDTAGDGRRALEIARARIPDLVLSDVMMPRMDGFELLRALRDDERTREIPVILLSARAGEEAKVEGLNTGANDYLIKPFSAMELVARIDAQLETARLRQEAIQRERSARLIVESEQARLREMFEQAPAAIALLRGPDHVYQLANTEYAVIFGRQRIYTGRPVRDVFADVNRPDIWELLDRVYNSGEPFIGTEWSIEIDRRGDGSQQQAFYNFVFQPIRTADDSVDGIFIHAVDVTDQVQARQQAEDLANEFAARKRQYEALLDASPDHVFALDRQGRFAYVNHAAVEVISAAMAGARATTDQIVGCTGRELGFDEEFLTRFEDDHQRVMAGEIVVRETLFPSPRGLRTFEYVLSPVRDDSREPELVVGFTRDVHDRNAAAAERMELLKREQAARQEAEAAVRARDEFLSIAAHELRTPVTAIKATAQLALRAQDRDGMDVSRAQKMLRTINMTADRLAALTNDLLDVSRLQGGQLALRPEPIDIVALVRGAVDRYGGQIDEGHVLELDLPSEMLVVDVDEVRMEQVLTNLLSNAVKYSPAGGAIEVALSRNAGEILIAITDSGIGLPDGAADRIFEPFGRADNATARNLPGMGLGLYVSRRIVEQHGGHLWAKSAGEGHGTTFFISLPGQAKVITR